MLSGRFVSKWISVEAILERVKEARGMCFMSLDKEGKGSGGARYGCVVEFITARDILCGLRTII